jgi:hypothetical protein
MSNSFPTTNVGNTISANPPTIIATLVVTLPTITRSGGYTKVPIPPMKSTTPTHTIPFKLESFAPISRAVSFCAAPIACAGFLDRARLLHRRFTEHNHLFLYDRRSIRLRLIIGSHSILDFRPHRQRQLGLGSALKILRSGLRRIFRLLQFTRKTCAPL